ncbi:MAG: hypothetical protein R3D67_12405 [Hyphomicrobiaceae bacterium]
MSLRLDERQSLSGSAGSERSPADLMPAMAQYSSFSDVALPPNANSADRVAPAGVFDEDDDSEGMHVLCSGDLQSLVKICSPWARDSVVFRCIATASFDVRAGP